MATSFMRRIAEMIWGSLLTGTSTTGQQEQRVVTGKVAPARASTWCSPTGSPSLAPTDGRSGASSTSFTCLVSISKNWVGVQHEFL